MTINYSLIDALIKLPGVVATGGFTYRGDQTVCHGQLSETEADMLAKAARATLEVMRMQGDILQMLTTVCPQGQGLWTSRGQGFCVPRPLTHGLCRLECFLHHQQ
ncbi:MAG: hypothetical protein B7Z82_09030 [Halothiobacillus sp. 20-54-6]|nr:MAG: hypothetical protein B7Z82_09030 [Halothiobacillus sp. 20-54-6]